MGELSGRTALVTGASRVFITPDRINAGITYPAMKN